MAPMLSIIWWRDIPAQVVAKDARRSSKVVLHPRFQVAIDKAANRAGMREYNAYIGEWRKTFEPCGDDLEAVVKAESERLEAEYTKHHLAELIQIRRRRRRAGASPGDHSGDLTDMTDTVPQLRVARGRHRLRPPVRDHRRADQPDRPQAPGRGDEGRRLQPGRARRAGPGRGRRPDARRQRRHPAGRRAGDPGQDDPARPEPDRPAAVDRFVDRRGARGRARRLPGQAAAQLGDRRGGAPRARPAARPQVRRRGRRDQQRRHRDQHGPGRPVRGRQADRRACRRPRHPALGHHRRPAGHADRRARPGRPAGVRARPPAARGAQGQHDLRRLERQLRPARTARASTPRSCRWRSPPG